MRRRASARFVVTLAGAGSFPEGRRPRALWIGIRRRGDARRPRATARRPARDPRLAGRARPFTAAPDDRPDGWRARADGPSRAGAEDAPRWTVIVPGGRPSPSTRATRRRTGPLRTDSRSSRPAEREPQRVAVAAAIGEALRSALLSARRRRSHASMAPSVPRQTKFVLDESRIPRAWYNIAADLPAPPPAAPPGHAPADRPRRPRAAVPDGAHRPGGQRRARDRDPRTGPRGLHALPAVAAATGPTGSRRRSIRRPTSTTSTRASARPAATSPTPRSRRPSTTRRRA